MSEKKEIVTAFRTKLSDECEVAYKVSTKEQLVKLNEIFKLAEHKFPAMYIDFFGMITLSQICEQDLKNIGYKIIEM